MYKGNTYIHNTYIHNTYVHNTYIHTYTIHAYIHTQYTYYFIYKFVALSISYAALCNVVSPSAIDFIFIHCVYILSIF